MTDGPPEGPRLLLVGLMGSGKTSVAHALFDRLGWPVVDNDVALAAGTGRTVTQLARWGPDALHRLERLQLALALEAPGPLVVTVAAGVADDPSGLRRLRAAGTVVYLRVDAARLAARVTGTARPWVAGDPVEVMEQMTARRDPALREAAHLVVDAGHATPEALAAEIGDRLGLRP